jgi:hypothetical protein
LENKNYKDQEEREWIVLKRILSRMAQSVKYGKTTHTTYKTVMAAKRIQNKNNDVSGSPEDK